MTNHPDPQSVIRSARQALSFVQLGWDDYTARGERADAGLMTAITTARSVSNVLQNLKNLAPGFEEWWSVNVHKLNTPGARWVVEARNMIEKQGLLVGASSAVHIQRIDDEAVHAMMASAPPNTVGIFLGDNFGRSGWNVRLEDGTEVQVFFSLPESIGRTWMHLPAVGGRPLEEVFPDYLRTLEQLVEDAASEFLQ